MRLDIQAVARSESSLYAKERSLQFTLQTLGKHFKGFKPRFHGQIFHIGTITLAASIEDGLEGADTRGRGPGGLLGCPTSGCFLALGIAIAQSFHSGLGQTSRNCRDRCQGGAERYKETMVTQSEQGVQCNRQSREFEPNVSAMWKVFSVIPTHSDDCRVILKCTISPQKQSFSSWCYRLHMEARLTQCRFFVFLISASQLSWIVSKLNL